MSLKKIFRILLIIQFAFGIGLALLTTILVLNQKELSKSQGVHYRTYRLADELRQSSDDLTRMARSYVATGNAEFERNYWAIVNIRNGKIPRPVEYNRIYWDLMLSSQQKPRPDTTAISLKDLMKQEGFTEEEFQKLSKAQTYSNELIKTEIIAMNAVKGLFDDGNGNYIVRKNPNREMAIRLMNDDVYHQMKYNIMKPIDDFFVMISERTASNVAKYEQRIMNLLIALGVIIIGIMGMFGFSFVILQRQIDERMLAEEALREAKETADNYLNISAVMIFTMNAQGIILSMNESGHKLLDYNSGELIGKNWFDTCIPKEMRSEIWTLFQKLMIGDIEHITTYENEVLTKSGNVNTLLWHNSLLRDNNGRINGILCSAQDITDRKKSEEKLRESEALYRAIIDASPDNITIADLQGRILNISPVAITMFGYTLDDASDGRMVTDFVVPEDRERAMSNIVLKLQGVKTGPIEYRGIRKDGSTFFIEVNSDFIRGDDEKPKNIVFIIRDISDRKRLENINSARERINEFAITHSKNEILQATLDEVEKLTDSQIGFYHFLEADQETLTLQAWSSKTLSDMCTAEGEGSHYNISKAGVWTDCIRERGPVVHNDYDSLPHRKGLPEGHAPVKRELVVPVLRGNKIVAILGVGNKKGNYTNVDVETVMRFADIAWDIAVRKRSEEELLESEDKYRGVVENSPNAITIYIDGKIVFVNDQCVHLMAATNNEDLIGKSVIQFVHPENRAQVIDWMKQVAIGGKPLPTAEEKFIRLDGTTVEVEVKAVPMIYKKRPAVQLIVQDITERKQVETKLHDDRERIKTILDTVGDPIFVKDNDHRIILANRAFFHMFGMDEKSVIGKTLAENVPEDERHHFLAVDRSVLDTGTPNVCEETLTVQGKTTRTIITTKVRFVESSGKKFLVGSIHDITEHLKSEQVLRQAQKLESIGTLAGGIAHNFNNLLLSMMGNVNLAKKRIPADSPAEKNLERSYTAMVRAATLTKQMLSYSGKGKVEIIAIDLGKTVEEHIDLFEASLRKNVRIETHLSPTPVTIKGDSSQIEQIVMNVIINAGEAIGEQQGVVDITVSSVTLSEEALIPYGKLINKVLKTGEYALFQVTDNGIGMDEETLAKIFDPFFTTKFVGRGLGLAAVSGIVRGHYGGIMVKSQKGVGTTFEVILPIHTPVVEPLQQKVSQSETIVHTPRVLLIDDEQFVIELIQDIFSDEPYQLLTAKDPSVGVTMYKEQWRTIDIVILDYSMPKMNGKEVLIELQKINPTVKVIMSSGYSEEELAHLMGGIIPTASIGKPHTPSALLSKISEVLEMK